MTYKKIIKKQIDSISEKLYNSSMLVIREWDKILFFDWTDIWEIVKEYDIENLLSINEMLDNLILQNDNKYWVEYKILKASWKKMEWWNRTEKIARIIYDIQKWEFSENEWLEIIKNILNNNE